MQPQHEPVRLTRWFWRGLFYGALLSLLGWMLALTILYWVFLSQAALK